jgi:4-alpha-glucanotransferase
VNEFARQHAQDIDFNIFLQQKVREDLSHAQKAARTAGMSIGLIADIAVGMSPHGSHAWSAQSDVLHGLTIGAPPDIFNTEGQNWGLTALSPSAGDRAFADTWSAGMKHAGGIRIDHILGLQRLWVIPEGASAAEGVYLRYPMHRLIRILAEESQRYHAIVIGEDLGTVPEGFRETIRAANILGMEVLWFQCDGGGYFAPEHWSRKAVALSTTHDLPTIAGWWSGRDIDWLEKLDRKSENGDANAERDARVHARWKLWNMIGQGAPPATDDYRSVVTAALEFVGRTADEIAIVPVEDVLALTEQPNIPGTTSQHPNWRRRLPAGSSFQHLEAHTNIAALLRGRSQR